MTHSSDYFTDLMQCSFARSKKRKNKNHHVFFLGGGVSHRKGTRYKGPYVLVFLNQKQVLTICATFKRALGMVMCIYTVRWDGWP